MPIVRAVASMTPGASMGGADTALIDRLQTAMVAAVKQCQAHGITDPETIRQAQLEARDRVLGR